MELREIYRGIAFTVRYDPVTSTFIGEFQGHALPVSVQAGTYEGVQDACVQAIDQVLLARAGSSAGELARSHATAEQVLKARTRNPPASGQRPPEG